MVSTRAQIITRRTYNRPLNLEGSAFETWDQTIDRVILHQKWLWERAQNRPLDNSQSGELAALKNLFLSRKALPAGRTLWLGGTELSQRREATQFNCSSLKIETVHDVVDMMWLLLQGCGVGFTPITGTLNGFAKPIEDVQVIRSQRPVGFRGREHNVETFKDGVWTISIGDSGEAWAKAIGKLLAGKFRADKLVFDLSEIRGPGGRLGQYGWISSGDAVIADALPKMAAILSRKADALLSKMDILDFCNWLGVIQTGRRGAQIALVPFGDAEWYQFATAKKDYWLANPQRAQSNNSLIFWDKPNQGQLNSLLDMMIQAGGSEPGFINGQTAFKRAPYFSGVNPCVEILLGNKTFCNLVEVNIAAFGPGDWFKLLDAIRLVARANYRQTCVNLDDGILQRAWHENNEFLRLCGVGLTGIVAAPWLLNDEGTGLRTLKYSANRAAMEMAWELNMPPPKNVTTVKPSGTLSKIMDTTEGCHKPLGRYIINNINFSKHDPIINVLAASGYHIMDNPIEKDAVLVSFPVEWENVPFTRVDGKEINTETAVEQLERYKRLMDNYVDHNVSITVSYRPEERGEIAQWIDANWNSYVGVSFILKADPSKTAEDLGYLYLPQEVVTREKFMAYSEKLKPIDIEKGNSELTLDVEDCVGGVCPVR